jgi:hypothetical protein
VNITNAKNRIMIMTIFTIAQSVSDPCGPQ